MTEYKGHPVPEVLPDDRLYYIICDEGEFSGWSEAAVLLHWKNKVDALWRMRSGDLGYVDLDDGYLGCTKCGAVVFDIYGHEKFHENLTN